MKWIDHSSHLTKKCQFHPNGGIRISLAYPFHYVKSNQTIEEILFSFHFLQRNGTQGLLHLSRLGGSSLG